MTDVDLTKLALPVLASRLASIKSYRDTLKDEESAINAELLRRFDGDVRIAMATQSKTHGTVNLAPCEGVKIKATVKQTVTWDQAMLRKVAGDMTWEDVDHHFRIKFDVPEAIYKALPPGSNVKPLLTAARTTKESAPVFTLEAA